MGILLLPPTSTTGSINTTIMASLQMTFIASQDFDGRPKLVALHDTPETMLTLNVSNTTTTRGDANTMSFGALAYIYKDNYLVWFNERRKAVMVLGRVATKGKSFTTWFSSQVCQSIETDRQYFVCYLKVHFSLVIYSQTLCM